MFKEHKIAFAGQVKVC